MRFNKQELIALASQTSPNFDREGVLILKERQDSFFRRSEGCSVRWFRLRGNLLFYLKGPEPWYEPMGLIVLCQHKIKVQNADENGHWPFQLVNDNGVCYRMATFHESERILWLKALDMAPYENLHAKITELKDKLNKIRTIVNVAAYRTQNNIVIDMNEVPFCELALSCDNLLCDTHGRPPSPIIFVYVQYPKGQCVLYDNTEIVETCSNPSFSKTILFRGSDALTGDAIVRLVVHDVKERVSETTVPMGYTSMKLSTIQEAQRLRVALQTKEGKTVGFVTLNGWSLEPSYIGVSPSHNNERNSIDISQKVLCHRRSQSLPPRLGLKLKFPSYSNLIKQNFLNSYQVTYRFHSGLGGDITVHETMAESKICFQMPVQLLDIYIAREKELLEELVSVGDVHEQWQSRQLELMDTHMAVLKHYCYARQGMINLPLHFKPSNKKEEAKLQFAPINLHLQRMWVHNDTLSKTGFHDVVTVGAFAAHTTKPNRTGGLIRLVQQAKDINSSKVELGSMIDKVSLEYDNIIAIRRHREEMAADLARVLMRFQARQYKDALACLEGVKTTVKSILALWDPSVVEESLSYIGWPKNKYNEEGFSQSVSSISRLTEEFRSLDVFASDCDTYDASSTSSSRETSPIVDYPTLSSSVPDIQHKLNEDTELQFHNDYFKSERVGRSDKTWNHSFRSVRSPVKHKLNEAQYVSIEAKRPGSFRHDFKSSASLEQVAYKSLVNNLTRNDKQNAELSRVSITIPCPVIDQKIKDKNMTLLRAISTNIEDALNAVSKAVDNIAEKGEYTDEEFSKAQELSENLEARIDESLRWLRLSHAALRLRWESPAWAWEQINLQTRRDICFTQALTTVTTGLLCWLSSVPHDVVVKLLTHGLGPLCGFEGLLSLYSSEKAMWGDMVVAVEDLHTVVFTLTKAGQNNSATPEVTGKRGALTVLLPVSDSMYARLTTKELSFTITAVFFNIGINEKANLAEALGENSLQLYSNSDNLDKLKKYYHKYTKVFPTDPMEPGRASQRTKPLEEVMENLTTVVHKKIPKNVEVLHLTALATRLMNGIRFTSCKSAKDRTGMAVTLEQCSILASEYHLAEHEHKRTLDIMRSEGCRRHNTQKNIGKRKYAFTKKQVMALPEEYRPPKGTYGSSQT